MAGGLLAIAGVGSSVLSPNLTVMFIVYGVVSGIGIGLMFLPTGISCNYYFKKKRAIANGIWWQISLHRCLEVSTNREKK